MRDEGCTEAQGFYIGEPRPLRDVRATLDQGKRRNGGSARHAE